MEKVELEAKLRKKIGTSPSKAIRRTGMVPAVVYGREIKPMNVEIDVKKFIKTISGEAGHNVIIELKISDDGKAKKEQVLTKNIQKNPLNGKIIHIDFHKIILTEAIKAKVPVDLIGVPVGVKEDGGILIHGLREIELKCLPTEIPEKYELDVSSLKINDTLHVSDLKAAKGVEFLTPETDMLAKVAPPTKEEELAPAPEVVAAEIPSEKGVPVAEEGAPPPEGKEAEKGAKPEKEAKPAKEGAPAKGEKPAKETKPEKGQKK